MDQCTGGAFRRAFGTGLESDPRSQNCPTPFAKTRGRLTPIYGGGHERANSGGVDRDGQQGTGQSGEKHGWHQTR